MIYTIIVSVIWILLSISIFVILVRANTKLDNKIKDLTDENFDLHNRIQEERDYAILSANEAYNLGYKQGYQEGILITEDDKQ